VKIGQVSLDFYHMNSRAKCIAAGRRARGRRLDLGGFTEVRSTQMRDGIKTGLGPDYEVIGTNSESPQFYNAKRWKLIGFRVVDGNKGVEGITPDLKFVIGTYQNIKRPAKVVEYCTTHFVPLTLHGKPRPQYQQRWGMWRSMWHQLKLIVAEALAKGHTIFVSGDFNYTAAGKMVIKQIHKNAKWVVRKGLDWVFVVESHLKVRGWGLTSSFASGSDHRAWARVVTLG
jgi:ketosteroid isomerase-like protein